MVGAFFEINSFLIFHISIRFSFTKDTKDTKALKNLPGSASQNAVLNYDDSPILFRNNRIHVDFFAVFGSVPHL
jgi:hypothetical protein